MLRGVTPRAEEMAGTAVLRIVVSSDSMKKATATSQGRRRLAASDRADAGGINRWASFMGIGRTFDGLLEACYATVLGVGSLFDGGHCKRIPLGKESLDFASQRNHPSRCLVRNPRGADGDMGELHAC